MSKDILSLALDVICVVLNSYVAHLNYKSGDKRAARLWMFAAVIWGFTTGIAAAGLVEKP